MALVGMPTSGVKMGAVLMQRAAVEIVSAETGHIQVFASDSDRGLYTASIFLNPLFLKKMKRIHVTIHVAKPRQKNTTQGVPPALDPARIGGRPPARAHARTDRQACMPV